MNEAQFTSLLLWAREADRLGLVPSSSLRGLTGQNRVAAIFDNIQRTEVGFVPRWRDIAEILTARVRSLSIMDRQQIAATSILYRGRITREIQKNGKRLSPSRQGRTFYFEVYPAIQDVAEPIFKVRLGAAWASTFKIVEVMLQRPDEYWMDYLDQHTIINPEYNSDLVKECLRKIDRMTRTSTKLNRTRLNALLTACKGIETDRPLLFAHEILGRIEAISDAYYRKFMLDLREIRSVLRDEIDNLSDQSRGSFETAKKQAYENEICLRWFSRDGILNYCEVERDTCQPLLTNLNCEFESKSNVVVLPSELKAMGVVVPTFPLVNMFTKPQMKSIFGGRSALFDSVLRSSRHDQTFFSFSIRDVQAPEA